MEAIRRLRPELDEVGGHAKRAPVVGEGGRGLLHLDQVPEPIAQRLDVFDRLTLSRDDGLQLVGEVALGEQLLAASARSAWAARPVT